MESLYTLGEWTVTPGREEAFVSAWRELAEWTTANVDGNTWAKLLRDRDEPRRFISFGPWASDDAVAAWREHPQFRQHVTNIQQLVDAFAPHDMALATETGPATPDP